MNKTEAERERNAAENRERQKRETVQCPHCGTPGLWSYGGLSVAWLAEDPVADPRKLTEFSPTIKWDGTYQLGADHSPKRCIAVLMKKRDSVIATLDEVVELSLKAAGRRHD